MLRLANIGFNDAHAREIAATPWLGQLNVLDLRRNVLDGAGMVALAESPHLAGLEELDVRLPTGAVAPMSDAVRERLRTRFAPRLRV